MRFRVRAWRKGMVTAFAAFCLFLLPGAVVMGGTYLPENVHDTSVHQDEALVNVVMANSQWPDCTTLKSATEDIFRLEGVRDGSSHEGALAFWKWFRILVSSTGGGYALEGPKNKQALVRDGHKIFAVYGHHQCDGLSWAMISLWRGAGLMALDECTLGHTTAALRYRDADGKMRYHTFDPQGRFYYWDGKHKRVGTRSVPVMSGKVYRHVMQPRKVHSLRTSLRWGETIERKWDNEGHVLPSGKPRREREKGRYYAYTPGKKDGVYAAVGEEVQRLVADTTPERFPLALYEGSENVACSPEADGRAALHPRAAGKVATFIYRLPPPYVVIDGKVEASLVKGALSDLCRLSLSTDGVTWQPIFEKEAVGEETVTIDIGRRAEDTMNPTAYAMYQVFVKAEFTAAKDVRRTGMNGLSVTLWRQLNKRTLPNLRPGENVLRVTGDRMAPGMALEVAVRYRLKETPHEAVRTVRSFPYYFKIDCPGVKEYVLKNYDKKFNIGDIQMDRISMRLVDANSVPTGEASLAEANALPAFQAAYPHPCDMTDLKRMKVFETDVSQTSGFFPQTMTVETSKERYEELVKTLKQGSVMRQWRAAEELGNYPEALDLLIEGLPRANIDLTLFIVKALSQIGDREAVGPLLAKWNRLGPRGAPGTRYIPDALAVLADESVVPDLVKPLPKCRFDYRFHIAHALGILGGDLAEKTLKDLAENDPFPPVREVAKEALAGMRAGK